MNIHTLDKIFKRKSMKKVFLNPLFWWYWRLSKWFRCKPKSSLCHEDSTLVFGTFRWVGKLKIILNFATHLFSCYLICYVILISFRKNSRDLLLVKVRDTFYSGYVCMAFYDQHIWKLTKYFQCMFTELTCFNAVLQWTYRPLTFGVSIWFYFSHCPNVWNQSISNLPSTAPCVNAPMAFITSQFNLMIFYVKESKAKELVIRALIQ